MTGYLWERGCLPLVVSLEQCLILAGRLDWGAPHPALAPLWPALSGCHQRRGSIVRGPRADTLSLLRPLAHLPGANGEWPPSPLHPPHGGTLCQASASSLHSSQTPSYSFINPYLLILSPATPGLGQDGLVRNDALCSMGTSKHVTALQKFCGTLMTLFH